MTFFIIILINFVNNNKIYDIKTQMLDDYSFDVSLLRFFKHDLRSFVTML